MRLTAILAVLLLVASNAAAACYWADPVQGDDSNQGTSRSQAFRTLKAAAQRLKAGDILQLAPGAVFKESLVLRSSGTVTSPIVVKGNGAVVSGLEPVPDDSWVEKGDGLWLSPNGMFWGACRPRVLSSGGELVSVPISDRAFRDPKLLPEGQAAWDKAGIWFRPEAGRRPQDYGLRGFYRVSGVEIVAQHYIVVEDLTAEYFTNDGFNVHGSCRGLVFRNITARWNGDDGFSVHEDVMANVYGLRTHHNDNGIADVALSQSMYCGALVESNRMCGVDFVGGMHLLRDSTVRQNRGMQIWVRNDRKPSEDPMRSARVFLEGVTVAGGEGAAVTVSGRAEVSALNCNLSGTDVGLDLQGGRLHVSRSAMSECRIPVRNSGECVFTHEWFIGVDGKE